MRLTHPEGILPNLYIQTDSYKYVANVQNTSFLVYIIVLQTHIFHLFSAAIDTGVYFDSAVKLSEYEQNCEIPFPDHLQLIKLSLQ